MIFFEFQTTKIFAEKSEQIELLYLSMIQIAFEQP